MFSLCIGSKSHSPFRRTSFITISFVFLFVLLFNRCIYLFLPHPLNPSFSLFMRLKFYILLYRLSPLKLRQFIASGLLIKFPKFDSPNCNHVINFLVSCYFFPTESPYTEIVDPSDTLLSGSIPSLLSFFHTSFVLLNKTYANYTSHRSFISTFTRFPTIGILKPRLLCPDPTSTSKPSLVFTDLRYLYCSSFLRGVGNSSYEN